MTAMETFARHADWGPGSWWPVFPIFWVLVLGIVLFAVFRARRGWGRWHERPSAEGVLAERYARGEISEQEYRERLAVLKDNR